ncbi:hypothetical protein GCM10022226_80100 [Sphaerisporangium flaviroseum]|uniref:Uncharacterized protein n=1 Tax=Sphaerisporangium flaviroseum TaxID=509199 RepID=A0ABP7JIJ9_9ACTN
MRVRHGHADPQDLLAVQDRFDTHFVDSNPGAGLAQPPDRTPPLPAPSRTHFQEPTIDRGRDQADRHAGFARQPLGPFGVVITRLEKGWTV